MTDDRKQDDVINDSLRFKSHIFKKQFPSLLQATTLRNSHVSNEIRSPKLYRQFQVFCARHWRSLDVVWVSHIDSGFVGSGIGPPFPRRDSKR